MLSDSIINSTEEKIKAYYRNLDEIERLECRLKLLEKQKSDVEDDIKNSDIILQCDIQGINYDSVRVQTSNTTSQQEKAIDKAYERLEKQWDNINCEIIEIKILKRDLEKKNSDIEFIVNKLNDEAKGFINMRYKEKKSYRKISSILHISESTICRLRADILADVSKWICVFF